MSASIELRRNYPYLPQDEGKVRLPTKAPQWSLPIGKNTIFDPTVFVVLLALLLVPLLSATTKAVYQSLPNVLLDSLAVSLAVLLLIRFRPVLQWDRFVGFFGIGINLSALLYGSLVVLSVEMAPPLVRNLAWFSIVPIVTGLLLYFALSYHVRRTESIVLLSDMLLLLAGLLALYGLLRMGQSATNPTLLLFSKQQFFSAFLVLLLPIALVQAFSYQNSMRQIPAQGVAGLATICLSLTGTRLTWVAVGAEILVLVLLNWFAPINGKRASSSYQRFLVPITIAAICTVVFVTAGGFDKRLQQRVNADLSPETRHYRRLMANAAATLLKIRPVFGIGPGSFPVYQHRLTGFGRPGAEVLRTEAGMREIAHNFWLQTASEQGMIAIAAFGAVLATFVVQGIFRLRNMYPSPKKTILLGCIAAVVGFTIDAFRNPAWQLPAGMMLLWVILGIGVACQRPRPKRPDA